MILDTEAAVIANFEFLGHTDMDMEEEEGDVEDEIYDTSADTKPNKVIINNQKTTKPNKVTYYFIPLLYFVVYIFIILSNFSYVLSIFQILS